MSQAATTPQPPSQADAAQGDLLEQTIEATPRQGVAAKVAKMLAVPEAEVFNLLRNVWGTTKGQPPLTNNEMFEGMSMIARFDLDPISREVYVTRDNKGKLMTMIAIDGWVKILDRTDHYDGPEVIIKFKEGQEGDLSAVISVTTKLYSTKRSHPVVYEAFKEEYAKLGGFMHATIPLHMLRIFSLRHAARLFTPLGGSVMLPEEAEWIKRDNEQGSAGTGPSHEEQAEAAAASRESQPKEPPAPETTPDPPQQDSEADQEAAVVRSQLLEDSGIGPMLAMAEMKGDVDKVAATIGANIQLDKEQKATLLEECDKRKKAIGDLCGERSKANPKRKTAAKTADSR